MISSEIGKSIGNSLHRWRGRFQRPHPLGGCCHGAVWKPRSSGHGPEMKSSNENIGNIYIYIHICERIWKLKNADICKLKLYITYLIINRFWLKVVEFDKLKRQLLPYAYGAPAQPVAVAVSWHRRWGRVPVEKLRYGTGFVWIFMGLLRRGFYSWILLLS